jgi:acyl-CoA synthetase (AMP-forming)/AMP-acid ligase II
MVEKPFAGAGPAVSSTDLAFLQFTSGSTSDPKGCMLAHGAALSNATDIFRRGKCEPGTTSVHWVPLHHDMGLMGGVLAPVVMQLRTTLMEPRCFMTRPLSWLTTIADRGVAHTSVSNFALAMVLKRTSRLKLASGALANIRNIFLGAEPIDPQLVGRFLDAMAPFGLAPGAIHPAYGLAEVTLVATSSPGGLRSKAFAKSALSDKREEDGTKEVACLGKPLPTTQVKIVDERGEIVPDGTVGQIILAAQSLTQGYWGNPLATAARLVEGWLATGDLGLIDNGELYVTGRHSELVIIAGRNIYPSDVENCVAEALETDPHRICAFGARANGTEKLVVVAEWRGKAPDPSVMLAAKERCVAEFGSTPAILLCAGSVIPRTTSGKPRRSTLAADYMQGRLQTVEPH